MSHFGAWIYIDEFVLIGDLRLIRQSFFRIFITPNASFANRAACRSTYNELYVLIQTAAML